MADGTIRFPIDEAPQIGTATEVADGILWFRLPLPMALDHVNIYALKDNDGWTIVDTGFNTDKTREIWENLLSGPLSGHPVTRVILTHHHPDHIGLAGWFQARGAAVCSTRTAWLFGRMLTLDKQDETTPETLTFLQRAGMDAARLERRRTEKPFNFADVVWPMPLGFTRIAEGDVIPIAGRNWTVHLGHGHAPDHATLWSDDGLVLAGDQILPGISPNLGVYATEPGADPVGEWIESCTRLQHFADPDTLALPGHKRPFRGVPARLTQLIENHRAALPRLEAFLAEPRSAVDLFPILYKREIGDGEYGLALVEAVGHLNHLLRLRRVTRELTNTGVYMWRKL